MANSLERRQLASALAAHLHYFDWARDWLEIALIQGQWLDQASLLEPLLDQWIEANPPGRGDGWHSYTLSLRIRNWIWLFRCCPQLATQLRIKLAMAAIELAPGSS